MARLFHRMAAKILRGADAASQAVFWFSKRLTTSFVASLLLVIFGVTFFVVGVQGIDFGVHWDEWYHGQGVAGCIQRLSLLPDGLSYGGLYFSLGFPVVIAHRWRNLLAIFREMRTMPPHTDLATFPSVVKFKADAAALVSTSEYVLEVRTVFLAVTTLAVFWVYGASLRCSPKRRGAALAGAAFMAFSWELGYHARWLAIDAPLAQFAALELFLFCGAWRAISDGQALRWYAGAAAAAGAVFACKMTGMFAVLPIVLLPLVRRWPWTWRQRLGWLAFGIALFTLVSFALSPALYLSPLHFLNAIRGGSADYNSAGPTYTHYVDIVEHAARLLVWYFWAVPSPFLVVAIIVSGIAFVGLASLLRHETRMTLSWLAFVVSFIAVFSRNHLLIVRQYLMCVPFWALCVSRGAAVVWDHLRARDRRLSSALVLVLVAGFATNLVFEARQGRRITRMTPDTIKDDAAQDLLAHPSPVRMSRTIFSRLRTRLAGAYTCYLADGKDRRVDHVIVDWAGTEWRSNRLRGFRHVYGAPEANMNYYGTWIGRASLARLLDVSVDVVSGLKQDMTADLDCFPAEMSPPADARPVPPEVQVQASAIYHDRFGALNAVDGFVASEWLLPDQTAGWLDVSLAPARSIQRVRLISGHNRIYNDRGIKDLRVEAYAGPRLIANSDGHFAAIDPTSAPLDLPLPAEGVDRVRVTVLSWFGLGAALAEVQVE